MSRTSDYWRDREREWLEQHLKDEAKYAKEVQAIYDYMLDEIEKEINDNFEKYASKEGISMAEAKKRAEKIDIDAYMRKAEKYVKEKDFSDQANKEMRLYNMTMRVNRLELLKAKIGLELTAGHDELVTYTGEKLTERVKDTLRKNAAILGPTVMDVADHKADVIVNSSFHNATFSDRIWQHQDVLRNELTNVLSNALIAGRNPREFIPDIRKRFDVSRYQAERLLRTELARVQIEAQKESYKAEDIDEYEYIACGLGDVCDVCRALDGKHFKVSKMVTGENAPPMHPNCHCATAPWFDRNEFDKYLEDPDSGDMTFEEWKKQKSGDIFNKRSALNRAKRIKNENDLISISKSSIISMNNIGEIKTYFSDNHGIDITGFDNKDLFAVKATLSGVDDFINEFSKAKDGIRIIKYNSHSKVYGRMSEDGIMTIGPQGLQSYGTGVHESAHALDFVMSPFMTNDFSKNIVENAIKQCKFRKNSKKLERILFDITNQFDDLDNYVEIYAYSMESEFGENSNVLTKAIFELTQGEL